jgi:hypothetical protein
MEFVELGILVIGCVLIDGLVNYFGATLRWHQSESAARVPGGRCSSRGPVPVGCPTPTRCGLALMPSWSRCS